MNWILVYDEERQEHLQVHYNPIVKDCIPNAVGLIPDVEFSNSTHNFDVVNCIWEIDE
ncbi:MAG: hypothetical protein J4F36_11305 [Nitrosopumilaceae archaeon]|nr:hypothetical protein [Nitrosopumilaceae archaeon]